MKKFLKGIWGFINDVLDYAIDENKNRLLLPPVLIAGIISGAVSIGTKIASDIKAKKQAQELDKQRAEEIKGSDKAAKEGEILAKGISNVADPTLANKKRDIKEASSDALGNVRATSSSTQENINAAVNINKSVNNANLMAETQAGQFKLNAKKLLSDRFAQSAQLRLAGRQQIDIRTQSALDAIGANAQATVDSAQSLGSMGIQAAGIYQNSDEYNARVAARNA